MFDPRTCAIPTSSGAGEILTAPRGVNNSPVSLQSEGVAGHFRIWRGSSRARYVFSVYSTTDCPPYEDAVAILARVERDGLRRAIQGVDTGCFPEAELAELRKSILGDISDYEIHVHVCARCHASRRNLLLDLGLAGRR